CSYPKSWQTPPGPSAEAQPEPEATSGRVLVVRLSKGVGTDVSHVGDRVVATVAAPLVDKHGQTLVPEGAVVIGHVRRSEVGKGVSSPKLELQFDRILDGRRIIRIDGEVAAADIEVLSPGLEEGYAKGGAYGGALMGALIGGYPGLFVGYDFGLAS